jgi:ubiquinone/menaquinone biosynthesis C-methylase UbiE
MNQVSKPVTEKKYWDDIHKNKETYCPKELSGFRNACEALIFKEIKANFNGGSILEVGGGSSDWLIAITKKLQPEEAFALDFSEIGCKSIDKKSSQIGINVKSICADMFYPPTNTLGRFDLVMSFGVVEHFANLNVAIAASAAFCKPGGILYTLIPNMAGLNGWLVKFWNRSVYDMHIPHDLETFLAGHNVPDLEVLSCEYLGSTNFGVLSACLQQKKGLNFWLYKQLTRLSKIIWLFESKLFRLPATRSFSPYIVSVSRITGGVR